MKIAFIINQRFQKRTRLLNLNRNLEDRFHRWKVERFETLYPTHAHELTFQCYSEGFDVIVAAGGDGTLNEVVNGYMLGKNKCSKRLIHPVLAHLPVGSANDFARSAGLTGQLVQLAKLIEDQRIRNIDAGKLTFDYSGNPMEKYFINIADVGFGAEVVRRVNRGKEWWNPGLNYSKAIVQSFLSFKKRPLKLKTQEIEWEGKILMLVMANGSYFGNGLCIAPGAELQNGKFSVVIAGNIGLGDYFLQLRKLKRGQKIDHPEVIYFSTSRLELVSTDHALWVEADGEIAGRGGVNVVVVPSAIPFLMP